MAGSLDGKLPERPSSGHKVHAGQDSKPEMMGVFESISEMWGNRAQERSALWMLNMVITCHGTAGGEPSPQKDNMFNRKGFW